MSTFWKGFAIFWIIFLVWYLTGGPQRITDGNNLPIKKYDSSISEVSTSPKEVISNSNATSTPVKEEGNSNEKIEKNFSNKSKNNTINLDN